MGTPLWATELSGRLRAIEQELAAALEEKRRKFDYELVAGRAIFGIEARRRHALARTGLLSYLRHSRLTAVATAPLIYGCVIPFALLDLAVSVYQAVCFPVFGIPKVHRRDYLIFDRSRLGYLNVLERLNCAYCSYANGLLAYATEIAARTEQHWCPVKHAANLRAAHSRYRRFFDYGDAGNYRHRIEELRADFSDLSRPQPKRYD